MDNRLIFLYHLVTVRAMGRRRRIGNAHGWKRASKQQGSQIGKSVWQFQAVMGRYFIPKFLISHCREKPLARLQVPVPQTDTGRRGENPKVIGRTLVKELGKMTP